ncbi:MAG: alcohol dehydrogenase catalytic domain-containing protein [Pirellulaceae bacterium]
MSHAIIDVIQPKKCESVMSEFDATSPFLAFYVQRHSDTGEVHGSVQSLTPDRLPAGDVIIQVEWSSLNYKDALAATGNPGVAKTLPHVPGIDAAGRIVQSTDSRFHVGQAVLVTGYELGRTLGRMERTDSSASGMGRAVARRIDTARNHDLGHRRLHGSAMRTRHPEVCTAE